MRKLGAANLILLCPSTSTLATYETIASPVKKSMSSGCLSHPISEYARFMNQFILCRCAGNRSKYAENISQHPGNIGWDEGILSIVTKVLIISLPFDGRII
jgi:hypothetical protein